MNVLQIVEELSYENEYLRNTCADQEGQVSFFFFQIFTFELYVFR